MFRLTLIAFMAIIIQMSHDLPARADNLAEPVLVEGSAEYQFRDEIRECVATEGVNFDRHYTVCSISATGAQPNFLIDRRTGKVQQIMNSELGIEVSRDSDILVINPVFWTSPGDPVPQWLWRKFYRFDERDQRFVFIRKNQEPNPRPAN